MSVTGVKRRTVGVLRDIFVVEDKGMFNVAFFRVNGRHADDLNTRAKVAPGWDVFIQVNYTPKLGQNPHPVLGREAHIRMVRHWTNQFWARKNR